MSANQTSETKHHIKDYVRTKYSVPETKLEFDIYDDHTFVSVCYAIQPNFDPRDESHDLILNGDETLKLLSVQYLDTNTNKLQNIPYRHKQSNDNLSDDTNQMIIDKNDVVVLLSKSPFLNLEIKCQIDPKSNTSLQGMYRSNNTYCTQCEATGFRNIIYSFDRPDVLSQYAVSITADSKSCPVILSNGNLINESFNRDTSRKTVVWHDPHPKPSYLFALVAGDLGHIESKQITKDGNDVTIRIYSPRDKLDQLDLAMRSIKKAMIWDEERFGLSYDLDLFNIVCLDDFNMGAMENKGLNIFNTKYVLATPETATDLEAALVTGVVGHEYFHNWTGNRVTLEKWFDLTLKEGLTVFRDQSFSQDIEPSRIRKIIDRAVDLRNGQFIEDDGSNAHPIRPQSYKMMDNFYTSTVYDKGAEIIRIYETLLGCGGFRKGMDVYFKRHDKTAVACEDFWRAMLDANRDRDRDGPLSQGLDIMMARLFNWYSQPGTPLVKIEYRYDNQSKQFIVKLAQSNKKCVEINGIYLPVLIPVRMGLIDRSSNKPVFPKNYTISDNIFDANDQSFVLNFCELEQEFVLTGIESDCIPSLMRDFSAPVRVDDHMSLEDRLILLNCDPNEFNRWEQSQLIHKKFMVKIYHTPLSTPLLSIDGIETYFNVLLNILQDERIDTCLKSNLLSLPLHDEMFSLIPECDPVFLYENVTQKIYTELARRSMDMVQSTDHNGGYLDKMTKRVMDLLNSSSNYSQGDLISNRELLYILMKIRLSVYNGPSDYYADMVYNHFSNTKNFTEKSHCISALAISINNKQEICPYNDIFMTMLNEMGELYRGDALMTAKWLRFVAKCASNKTVKLLSSIYMNEHKFSSMVSKTTPNHIYGLVNSFTFNPYVHWIETDHNNAPGYKYITDCVIDIDTKNPNVASKIAEFFTVINNLSPRHQRLMRPCISRILSTPNISENVKEILESLNVK
jgi:aminopeptidase N